MKPYQLPSSIPCCLCGGIIRFPNNLYTCTVCLASSLDFSHNLQTAHTLHQCRQCERFQLSKNQWVSLLTPDPSLDEFGSFISHPFETEEMKAFCLNKIKKIQKTKKLNVLDASFVGNDPYARKLCLSVRLERPAKDLVFYDKDFRFAQNVEFSFAFGSLQCEDCRKSFTPNGHSSVLQVRQKAGGAMRRHNRTAEMIRQKVEEKYLRKDAKGERNEGAMEQILKKSKGRKKTQGEMEVQGENGDVLDDVLENFKKLGNGVLKLDGFDGSKVCKKGVGDGLSPNYVQSKNKYSKGQKKRNTVVIEDVREFEDGFDVHFVGYNSADAVASFVRSLVPVVKEKKTTKLLTHCPVNNTERRIKTIYIEVCPFSRGDLLLADVEGKKSVCVVNKVASKLWLANVETNEEFSVPSFQLSKGILTEFRASKQKTSKDSVCFALLLSKSDLETFSIVGLESVGRGEEASMVSSGAVQGWRRAKVIDSKSKEMFETSIGFWTKEGVREGDTVVGYNLRGRQFNDEEKEKAVEGIVSENKVIVVGRVRDRRRRGEVRKEAVVRKTDSFVEELGNLEEFRIGM